MADFLRLLVIDDDYTFASQLRDYLEPNGFRVEITSDEAGMKRALESPHDIVIFDQNLPGGDIYSLCRRLRDETNLPLILITVQGGATNRIQGLEAGADDCLSKPIEPRELLARIKSVLRRAHALPPNMTPKPVTRLSFAGWTIDLVARRLVDHRGIEVCLSGAEFRILKILLENHTKVLSRDQLIHLMTGRDAPPFDRSVDLLISRLRQKLDDDAKFPRIIMTVRSEGYVIVAPTVVENE